MAMHYLVVKIGKGGKQGRAFRRSFLCEMGKPEPAAFPGQLVQHVIDFQEDSLGGRTAECIFECFNRHAV